MSAAEYRYQLRVRSSFEAAHRLEWHHKCRALHGHTYHVELVVGSNELDENGVVIDLSIIRGILTDNLPDHAYLNNLMDNPTVERIADKILSAIRHTFITHGYDHYQPFPTELTVWETPTGGVTVT